MDLYNVPKLLKDITQKWCPDAMIISFKLETDEKILEKKCIETFEKYHTDMIIANILETRYNHVILYLPTAEAGKVEALHVNKIGDENIEKPMIDEVIKQHEIFIK